MRAFIAAGIPDNIRERLSEAALSLSLSDIRIVDRNNMHFTLAFLGELEGSSVDNVIGAIDRISFRGFHMEIKGMYSFGNPGAIYSAVAAGADSIIELAGSLRAELSASNIYFDEKDFVPHVTIARMKRRVDEKILMDELYRFADKRFGGYAFLLHSYSVLHMQH